MSNSRLNTQEQVVSPYFSIILPIYNVAPYLEQCIHSVLEQDFFDYELILVDDGSTDQCPEICDQYAARFAHIRVIHKVNGGLSSARNAGMEIARGQYIWWVDSDDWIEPDSLRILHEASCDRGPDMVKFNFTRTGNKQKAFFSNAQAGFYSEAQERKQLLDKAFRNTGKFCLSAWSHIYRNAFLKKNGLSFVSERQIGSEDYLFNLQAFLAADNIRVIGNRLYHYRHRAGSLTQRYRKNLPQKYTELYKQLRKYYEQMGVPENYTGRISYFYVWHLLHGTCFANEYRICDGHTRKDGRKNVCRFLNDPDFQYAAKLCHKEDLYWKQWLQVQAMRLRWEPVFYWLYVVKPRIKKGFHHETKD